MNKSIVILILVIFYTSCSSGLTIMDEKDLILKKGRMYKPKFLFFMGEEKPYNGVAIKYFEGGAKECQGPYVNGRREGIWTYWHEPIPKKLNRGIREGKGPYKIGIRDGYWTYWYTNGVKREEGKFQGQERVGKWIYYNKDGEIIHVREF